ncbi:MAG: hypothetical protein WCC92_16025 [Candidatus Korobacteraceae bacterium]
MSPRKLVQIANTPNLPTIKDYFGMMAEEQAEDIRRLKQAAAGKNPEQPGKPPSDKAVPHPWLLHPIRRTKRSAAKASANSATRSAPKKASKKAAKKAARKASKKARR